MKSLRTQLLLGTAVGTAVVLFVSGLVLYALTAKALQAEFDASLAAKARSLATLAEWEGDRLEFDLVEMALPEFEPSADSEYCQVWWPDGTVFARSPSLHDADLVPVAGTIEAPVFRSVRLPDGRPGRVVGIGFTPRRESEAGDAHGPMAVMLVLGRSVIGLQATLARLRTILIAVGLIAIVLSAGVLTGVVRRNLRPVDFLTRQIARVGENALSRRIDARGMPRELSPVVDRLNDLLARLDAAFQRERRFTGDVAHELRTPLAGLRAKIELALSRPREAEAYREFMDDCLEISLQMQRMGEALLNLARADAGQLEIRRQQVDLSRIVRQCWEPLQPSAARRGLNVAWRLEAPDILETDPDKVRLIIQNVLDNAVTYVNDQGRVSITVSEDDGAAVLAVSNTGSGLSSQDLAHVFDRFWRADSSCGEKDQPHCGLGLPLCRAMIEHLGGSIEAACADGNFTVTIRLPHAALNDKGGQEAEHPTQEIVAKADRLGQRA